MNKQEFEHLVEAFNELMDELEKTKVSINKESDETTESQKCDCNSEYCDSYEDEEQDAPNMTPLEELVFNRVVKHIKDGTFPTLEEAQTIHILDSINNRYNR